MAHHRDKENDRRNGRPTKEELGARLLAAAGRGSRGNLVALIAQGAQIAEHVSPPSAKARSSDASCVVLQAAKSGNADCLALVMSLLPPITRRAKFLDAAYMFSWRGPEQALCEMLREAARLGISPQALGERVCNAALNKNSRFVWAAAPFLDPKCAIERERGQTLLMAAASSGMSHEMLAPILAASNPNAVDCEGNTALMRSAAMADINTARLLLGATNGQIVNGRGERFRDILRSRCGDGLVQVIDAELAELESRELLAASAPARSPSRAARGRI